MASKEEKAFEWWRVRGAGQKVVYARQCLAASYIKVSQNRYSENVPNSARMKAVDCILTGSIRAAFPAHKIERTVLYGMSTAAVHTMWSDCLSEFGADKGLLISTIRSTGKL